MNHRYVIGICFLLILCIGCRTSVDRLAVQQGLFSPIPEIQEAEIRAYGAILAGPPLRDGDIVGLVLQMGSLPEWPTDRDLASEEWDLYVRMAAHLQLQPHYYLEQLFLAYTVWVHATSADISESHDRMSRPFILLRVMFDLPRTPWMWRDHDGSLSDHLLFDRIPTPNGSFEYHVASDEHHDLIGSYTSPVLWRGAGPTLIAYRDPNSESIAYSQMVSWSYLPSVDFRFFLRWYKYRDLQRYVDQQR